MLAPALAKPACVSHAETGLWVTLALCLAIAIADWIATPSDLLQHLGLCTGYVSLLVFQAVLSYKIGQKRNWAHHAHAIPVVLAIAVPAVFLVHNMFVGRMPATSFLDILVIAALFASGPVLVFRKTSIRYATRGFYVLLVAILAILLVNGKPGAIATTLAVVLPLQGFVLYWLLSRESRDWFAGKLPSVTSTRAPWPVQPISDTASVSSMRRLAASRTFNLETTKRAAAPFGRFALKTRVYAESSILFVLVALGYLASVYFNFVSHVNNPFHGWFLVYLNHGLTPEQSDSWATLVGLSLIFVAGLGLALDVLFRKTLIQELPSVILRIHEHSSLKLAGYVVAFAVAATLAFYQPMVSYEGTVSKVLLALPFGDLWHAEFFVLCVYMFSRISLFWFLALITHFGYTDNRRI
jgi:hypothetical protein